MKRFMMHSMFAAAALAVGMGSSSAQTLSAEIPFAFRAGDAVMQPGTYQIKSEVRLGARTFSLYNRDDRQSVVLIQSASHDVRKDWTADRQPKMAFECAGSRCALREIWTGGPESYGFSGPKHTDSAEPVRTTVLNLVPHKGF